MDLTSHRPPFIVKTLFALRVCVARCHYVLHFLSWLILPMLEEFAAAEFAGQACAARFGGVFFLL